MKAELETCANCGEPIGRLETPQLYQNQIVCARCIAKLGSEPDVAAAIAEEASIPRGSGLNYETREEVRRRLGAPQVQRTFPYPAPAPASGASPILIIGRVVFGGLAVLGLVAVLRGRFGEEYDQDLMGAGLTAMLLGGIVFGLTFVKRAF